LLDLIARRGRHGSAAQRRHVAAGDLRRAVRIRAGVLVSLLPRAADRPADPRRCRFAAHVPWTARDPALRLHQRRDAGAFERPVRAAARLQAAARSRRTRVRARRGRPGPRRRAAAAAGADPDVPDGGLLRVARTHARGGDERQLPVHGPGARAFRLRGGRETHARRARDLLLGQRAQRIDGGAVDAHLEVQVWAGRVAGRADEADANALSDPHADAHVDARQVCVHAALAVAVRDSDEEAVAVTPTRPDDLAGVGGIRGRAEGRGQVDAGVPVVTARPEAVA